MVDITRDAVSVTEGAMASFTVTRTGPTTAALEVLLAVSEDSTGGRDFVDDTFEVNTMVSIPIGSSSAKFTVATINNDDDEPNGSLTVSLRFSANYTWGISFFARVTINDNDLPLVSITPGAAVPEGTAATFTVAREGVTTGPLTVLLSVSEDSTGGRDFVAPGDEGNKMVTIDANQLSASYSVDTTGDTTDEPNGVVTVSIRTDATTYRIDSANNDADVTVNDNDLPEVSITPGSAVTEGTAATFTVARVGDTTGALTVLLSVSEDSTGGRDFVAPGDEGNKMVTIAANQLLASYSVDTTGDTIDEPNGVVTVSIRTDATTYRIDSANNDADVTVNDNDGTTTNNAPTLANAIPDRTATVGSVFTYAFPANTFTDPDGDDLSYSVTTKPSWLNYNSNTRTFSVTPQTAHIGTHTVTISASDGTLSVTDSFDITVSATPPPDTPMVSITGGTSDGNSVTFTVSRTGPTTAALTVLLTVTEDDTQGQDFVPPNAEGDQEVIIPAGRQSTTYSVLTNGDGAEEQNGRVTVTIRPSGGVYAIDETQNTSEVTVNVDDEGTSDSLVRFGRTLGVQAVNTITDRLSSPRQFGLTGQVAGQTLVNGQRPTQQQNTLPTNPPNHTPGGADPLGEETTIATDTLQTGTAFTYTEETPNGTTISYWGQGTGSSFASASITDGKVTTLAFGTDWQKDKRTYGLMIARSSGDITYRQGSIERTMTTRMRAIIPYGGMDLANNLSLWGAFGLGQGDLTLKPLEDNGDEQTTDLDWHMVASGIRGDLSSLDLLPGAELGWRADALWTRTSSDEQEGLPATRSKSTRLRVGLEMGWNHQLASSTIVRPYMGIDILYDGGDAETGLGVDVSGGVDWFDPAKGLTVGLSGHKVIHHVDDAYESWGVSFSLAYDPRPETKEGFSAVVSHAVDREEVFGGTSLVGTTPAMDNPVIMDRNWQMEAAYGTARAEGMVGSSYTRVRGSDDPEDLRVGYRIEPDTEIAEDLTVDTWASSPLEDGVASNAAGVDLVWRW